MRTKLTLFLLLVLPSFILADKAVAQIYVPNSHADEAYIFAYATDRNAGRNGLHLAWSSDLVKWHEIGPEYAFVKSDYGAWGSQKRMIEPRLMRQEDGSWVAIWRLNEQEEMMAIQTKLRDALDVVGREGGYVCIFDLSGGMPYVSKTLCEDVTKQVRTKLGIPASAK